MSALTGHRRPRPAASFISLSSLEGVAHCILVEVFPLCPVNHTAESVLIVATEESVPVPGCLSVLQNSQICGVNCSQARLYVTHQPVGLSVMQPVKLHDFSL